MTRAAPLALAWDLAARQLYDLAGVSWAAGEPLPGPWRRRDLYLVGPSPWSQVLETYARPGDSAAGPRLGEPAGVTLGGARIYSGGAWGLDHSLARAQAELEELRAAAEAEGWTWAATSGALAGRLVRAEAEAAGWAGQLRPRWRDLARQALHQGPMVAGATRAARECVQVDRREAYLRALAEPMPDARRFQLIRPGASVAGLLRAHRAGARGIVAAHVVLEDEAADCVSSLAGPLPVRVRTGTVWPVGSLAGVWTLDVLAAALELWPVRGVRVAGGYVSPGAPLLAPVAERLDRVAHRGLRRLCYTRAWGQLAFEGWPEARVVERPAPDAPGYWTGVGVDRALAWSGGGVGYGPEGGPIYRPDLAATVAGYNVADMARGLALAGREAIMALVDAIFCSPAAAERVLNADPDGWTVKGSGPIAVLAPGVYVHAGRIKAMGAPAWLPAQERLRYAEAVTLAADPVSAARLAGGARWADRPPEAVEAGHHSTTAEAVFPSRGGPWTPRGWLRTGTEPEAERIETRR